MLKKKSQKKFKNDRDFFQDYYKRRERELTLKIVLTPIITIAVVAISMYLTHAIANSDLPFWLKLWLLR